MSVPDVSVLMPAYNAEAYLDQAVASVVAQTFPRWELLIVDDGATDRTGAMADGWAARDPRIRVVHQPNGGLVAARNAAIAAARGRYLALLDSDDVWHPHHLAEAVAVLDADPACGLVHANIRRIDATGAALDTPGGRWPGGDAQAWRRVFLREEHVSCPTVVFRADLLAGTGPFDEHFNRLGCEDRDLWLRLLARAPARYLDDVHADYRLHGGNMSKAREKMERARQLLVDKHGATPEGRRWRPAAQAVLWSESADERRREGLRGDALRRYALALRQRPGHAPAWKGLVKALMGRRT